MNIYCILNPIQVWLSITATILLLKNVFGYEVKVRKVPAILLAVIIIALNIILSCFVTDKENLDLIAELSTLGLTALHPYFIFKYSKRWTFLKFGVVLCATFDFIVFTIWSPFTERALIVYRLLYCFVYLLVIAIILLLSKRVQNSIPCNFLEQIPTLIYIVIFIADLSAFYDVSTLFNTEYSAEIAGALKLFSSALVVICIAIVAIRYSRSLHLRREAELMLNMQLKHYEEVMQKNRDIRAFRHDYRNNLFSIKAMLNKGKTADAIEYVDELNDSLSRSYSDFMTGNYLADAILGDKALTAQKCGIKLEFDGRIPQQGISNNDLCTILANALDNAVRGAEGSHDARVTLAAKEKEDMLLITVVNTVKEKVQIKNNSIQTTKSDKENHGFGIDSIKRTAKKYDGYVNMSCDDNKFVLSIALNLKGEVR